MVINRRTKRQALKSTGPDVGISTKSLTIARIVDRLCRKPGQYQIVITIPSYRSGEWRVTFNKVDKLREVELKR